jgi:hypothetical protein
MRRWKCQGGICRTTAVRVGNLLIETSGGDRNNITRYGTRQGIFSTTLPESMVMLYEATDDTAYLDFSE